MKRAAQILSACVVVLGVMAGHVAIAGIDEPRAVSKANFRVDKDENGVWWFVGPDGHRFYSIGVNNVTPSPYMPRANTRYYDPVPTEFGGDEAAWGRSTRALLMEHGFNTLGAWSSDKVPAGGGMYRTPVLYTVAHAPERCLRSLLPGFEEFVRENVREAAAKLGDRSEILGVFLDNEMPWFGKSGWDDIPTYTLLEKAIERPKGDEIRKAAVEFLKARHDTPAALAAEYHIELAAWDDLDARRLQRCSAPAAKKDRDDFTTMLADRYFDVSTKVVREELPGLMILGTRFPGSAPDPVIRACGRTCDVMSVNLYFFGKKADAEGLGRFWTLGGRPIMHTEYSWRARDNASGDPNTRGAGAILATQAERGEHYSGLVEDIATLPVVIASHWFEFADQSPEGRFDGEDSNYGIVDIRNKPYSELLSAMKRTNTRVAEIHRDSRRVMPSGGGAAGKVSYTPGQHPERPSKMDLLQDWVHPPEVWGAPDAKLNWKRDGADLVLDYDAGSQYGAGLNIFGPRPQALDRGPDFATDLDGYQFLVLEVTAPKDIQINLVLAEAGAAASDSPKFDTRAGDDGEGFISDPLFGTGSRNTIRVPIAALHRQQFFGNRSGQQRIDMQAIRNLGIQVQGEPKTGRVTVHAFLLER